MPFAPPVSIRTPLEALPPVDIDPLTGLPREPALLPPPSPSPFVPPPVNLSLPSAPQDGPDPYPPVTPEPEYESQRSTPMFPDLAANLHTPTAGLPQDLNPEPPDLGIRLGTLGGAAGAVVGGFMGAPAGPLGVGLGALAGGMAGSKLPQVAGMEKPEPYRPPNPDDWLETVGNAVPALGGPAVAVRGLGSGAALAADVVSGVLGGPSVQSAKAVIESAAREALPAAERAGMKLAGIDPATGLRRTETLGMSVGVPPPGAGEDAARAAEGAVPPPPGTASDAAEQLAGIRPAAKAPPEPPRPEPPHEPIPAATAGLETVTSHGLPEGAEERGFAQTVRTTEDTAPAIREALRADPASYYMPTSNKAAAKEAADLINADRDAARSLVYDAKTAPDAVTSAVGQILVRMAEDAGQFDEAVRLTEALAARATQAGQFTQAFAMYGRMAPASWVRWAQKLVKDAEAAGIKTGGTTQQRAKQIVSEGAKQRAVQRVQKIEEARAAAPTPVKTVQEAITQNRPILYTDVLAEVNRLLFPKRRPSQPGAARLMQLREYEMAPEDAARFYEEAQQVMALPPEQLPAARTALLDKMHRFRQEAVKDENIRRRAAEKLRLLEERGTATAERKAAAAAKAEHEAQLREIARIENNEARAEDLDVERIKTAVEREQALQLRAEQRQARDAEQLRLQDQAAEFRRAEAAAAKQASDAEAQQWRQMDAEIRLENQRRVSIARAEENLARQKADAMERAVASLNKQRAESAAQNISALEQQRLLSEAQARAALTAQKSRAAEAEAARKERTIGYFTDAEARAAKEQVKQEMTDQVLAEARRTLKPSGVELPPALADNIYQRAAHLRDMPEGRDRTLYAAEILRDVHELVPVSLWRKLATGQTMAQLLNPKTTIRNLGGNALFAGFENVSKLLSVGLDLPVSLATGKRSTTLPALAAQRRGLVRGAREGVQEARLGVNTPALPSQFDLPGGGGRQGRVFAGNTPVLSGLETGLSLSLRAPDRAFYQAAFDDAALSGAWVRAYNEGKRGAELGQRQLELVAGLPEDLVQEAQAAALFRTFQDDNVASWLFSQLKKGLNLGKEFGIGDMVLKYPRTPAALLMRSLEYSPFGFLETVGYLAQAAFRKPFNQKAFVESAARATVGTVGLTGTGYVLAANGLLTGRSSKDPDVRAQNQLQGIREYDLNLSGTKRWVLAGFDPKVAVVQPGDTWVSYDWAQPMAVSVALGAQAARPGKKTPKVGPLGDGGILQQLMDYGETAVDVLAVGMDTLAVQPMVQGVHRLFGGENPMQAFVNVLKDAPASFVPTLLSQANQAMDNTIRDTYDTNGVQEALNRALAKVPILAASMPPAVDVWGEPKDRYHQDTNNLFNVFVSPAFVSQYFPKPEAAMLLELQRATGETGQFPRDTPNHLTITQEGKTVDYVLSPQQAREYQVALGQMTRQAFSSLAANSQFRAAKPEEQITFMASVLTALNTDAKDLLRSKYQEARAGVTQLPPPEVKKASKREELNARNVAEYFKAKQLFEPYDKLPDTLKQANRAYAAADAEHERLVAAATSERGRAALKKFEETNQAWDDLQHDIERGREKMRQSNKALDDAGVRFRAWQPVRPVNPAAPPPPARLPLGARPPRPAVPAGRR